MIFVHRKYSFILFIYYSKNVPSIYNTLPYLGQIRSGSSLQDRLPKGIRIIDHSFCYILASWTCRKTGRAVCALSRALVRGNTFLQTIRIIIENICFVSSSSYSNKGALLSVSGGPVTSLLVWDVTF